MRGSKAGARFIRRARKLMNDGGKHWSQGNWKAKIRGRKGDVPEDYRYCWLGGLQQVIFGDTVQGNDDRFKRLAYTAALEVSTRVIAPDQYANLLGELERGKITKLEMWSECESIVIKFNDWAAGRLPNGGPVPHREAWAAVDAKLEEVERELVAA